MQELVFEVVQEADGGYTAEALGESIYTQGDTWDELRQNVREAVEAFFFDRQKRRLPQLRGRSGAIRPTCRPGYKCSRPTPPRCNRRQPLALPRKQAPA